MKWTNKTTVAHPTPGSGTQLGAEVRACRLRHADTSLPCGLGTHHCLGHKWVELQMAVNLLLIAYHVTLEMVPASYFPAAGADLLEFGAGPPVPVLPS